MSIVTLEREFIADYSNIVTSQPKLSLSLIRAIQGTVDVLCNIERVYTRLSVSSNDLYETLEKAVLAGEEEAIDIAEEWLDALEESAPGNVEFAKNLKRRYQSALIDPELQGESEEHVTDAFQAAHNAVADHHDLAYEIIIALSALIAKAEKDRPQFSNASDLISSIAG